MLSRKINILLAEQSGYSIAHINRVLAGTRSANNDFYNNITQAFYKHCDSRGFFSVEKWLKYPEYDIQIEYISGKPSFFIS